MLPLSTSKLSLSFQYLLHRMLRFDDDETNEEDRGIECSRYPDATKKIVVILKFRHCGARLCSVFNTKNFFISAGGPALSTKYLILRSLR